MPRFSQLSDWLAWLETLHPKPIDLGLERVFQVANKLQLLKAPTSISHQHSGALAINNSQTFIVAGTNGKGSCVTTIEQCLKVQQHSVGTYTSPHLHHYCERIQIDGKPVAESLVCEAFSAIDHARGSLSLTYFEFGTLAALWIFVQQQIPFVVLEVGLGGRLDAVNIVDADIAIITSIAVDHEEWLGNDRELIALEKLGVTRSSKPVVIAENNLTDSLKAFSKSQSRVYTLNDEFFIQLTDDKYCLWTPATTIEPIRLSLPVLPTNSVIAGLQALYLSQLLPTEKSINHVIEQPSLLGRYQQLMYQGRQVVFDVAHNPAAAQVLADRLAKKNQAEQNTLAVFAVMDDKDIDGIVAPLSHRVTHWYIAKLAMNERSASENSIAEVLQSHQQVFSSFEQIEFAFESAITNSAEHDRIIVFGSFFTVAAIQKHIGAE